MERKRGLKELLRNNFISLIFVIALICLGGVFAGDVIVKEGNMDVGGSGNFSGKVYSNGTDLSNSANYEFGNNNFNGSGNFITTGSMSLGGFNTNAIKNNSGDGLGAYVQSFAKQNWSNGINYGFIGVGYYQSLLDNSAATGQVMGGVGRGYYLGSNSTLNYLVGLKGENYVWNESSNGNITNMISLWASTPSYGGGASAGVNSSIGVLINDRGVGNNRWAIYHSGTDNSKLGGRLGIGKEPSNSSMLDISKSEVGSSSQQDLISGSYTLTGANSYNSIGRGVQGLYLSTLVQSAINHNGIYVAPSMANSPSAKIDILTGISTYSGFGYNANATVTTAQGLYVKGWGNTYPNASRFTNHYGIKIDNITGAANNFGIYAGGTNFNYFNGYIGIGTTNPLYPLHIGTNTSQANQSVSIFASGNISATGFITRTSTYDKSKGDALDLIKDSNEYKNADGTINHKSFYGYAGEFLDIDYSRPETKEICNEITDEEGNIKNECKTETTYPYTKIVEGVSLDEEVNVLRQAVYELKIELCKKDSSYEWC